MPPLLPLLSAFAAALLLSACGGGGGGSSGPPPLASVDIVDPDNPARVVNTAAVAERYPELPPLNFEIVVVSPNPAFASEPPWHNAQKLGEYNLAGVQDGRAVVWITPAGPDFADPVAFGGIPYRLEIRVYVPADAWRSGTFSVPDFILNPSGDPECAPALNLKLVDGKCQTPPPPPVVANDCSANNGRGNCPLAAACVDDDNLANNNARCECPPELPNLVNNECLPETVADGCAANNGLGPCPAGATCSDPDPHADGDELCQCPSDFPIWKDGRCLAVAGPGDGAVHDCVGPGGANPCNGGACLDLDGRQNGYFECQCAVPNRDGTGNFYQRLSGPCVDECAPDNGRGPCVAGATCYDGDRGGGFRAGNAQCECPGGTVGDGRKNGTGCVPEAQAQTDCFPNPCNGQCRDADGAKNGQYECRCDAPSQSEVRWARNHACFNECVDKRGKGQCHEIATCIDPDHAAVGNAICQCPEGMEGDGRLYGDGTHRCHPPAQGDCSPERNPCVGRGGRTDARCRDDDGVANGNAQCWCDSFHPELPPSGQWSAPGQMCHNECAAQPCVAEAACRDLNPARSGGLLCQCPEGHVGDGTKAGTGCEIIAASEPCDIPGHVRDPATGLCACPDEQCRARDRELSNSNGGRDFNLVRIHDEMGLTGEGVTVAVNDYGPLAYENELVFGGPNATVMHPDLPSIRIVNPRGDPEWKTDGCRNLVACRHGLATLGQIAAQINGTHSRGIAPGASFLYTYSFGGHKELIAAGAEIINNSWGSTGPFFSKRDDYFMQVNDGVPAADRTIMVFTTGNGGGTVTHSPGVPAHSPGSAPFYYPELRGHYLAVAAAAKDGKLADNSNHCGPDSAEWCLAAPQHDGFLLDNSEDGLRPAPPATSYAAPIVSGALALMKQYYNRMGGIGSDELVRRLLATADKGITVRNGATVTLYSESEYGAGVLDLENALSPQGMLATRFGAHLNDARAHSLSQSELVPGAALGDAAHRALRGQTLAVFDELNAPFPASPEEVLSPPANNKRKLSEALRARQSESTPPPLATTEWNNGTAWFSLNAPGDSNFAPDSGSHSPLILSRESGNPYAALTQNGIVAGGALQLKNNATFRAAIFGENIHAEPRTRGALMEWSLTPVINAPVGGCTPDRNLPPPQSFSRKVGQREGSLTGLDRSGRGCNPRPAQWSFQFGAVQELDGMLQSTGGGVFGALRSRTTFAGINWRSPEMFNNWRIRLAAHAGRTSSGSGTWLSATERLWSGSYALGLERGNVLSVGDSLGFSLRQPLRTENGFRMRIPTGRTKYGELTWREVSGEPSGRELEFEARYGRRMFGGSWWVSAGVVEDAGHDASAKTEGRGLVGFEKAF